MLQYLSLKSLPYYFFVINAHFTVCLCFWFCVCSKIKRNYLQPKNKQILTQTHSPRFMGRPFVFLLHFLRTLQAEMEKLQILLLLHIDLVEESKATAIKPQKHSHFQCTRIIPIPIFPYSRHTPTSIVPVCPTLCKTNM